MRTAVIALGLLVVPVFVHAQPRPYQPPYDPYPWCAVYGVSMSGSTNCGFRTWQQCMATVSGIGGSCEPNQFYNPQGRTERQRRRQPR